MSTTFEQLAQTKSAAIINSGIREFASYTYSDANTDRITAECGISKGLLYHYFGTKKKFYLCCLSHSLKLLTKEQAPVMNGDFYNILFSFMEQKMKLCTEHPTETKLVNYASREFAKEVKADKDKLLGEYAVSIHTASQKVLIAAVNTLNLKNTDKELATKGLNIYTNALINQWLMVYRETPDEFFAAAETIKKEIKTYIDLMLFGICKEKK